LGAACRAGADGRDWLDARECGASGSIFETRAATEAGSRRIVAADAGDFRPGQGVIISRCNPRCDDLMLWGPRHTHARRPVKDEIEIRGDFSAQGDWTIFLLDIAPANPSVFRWSSDLARTWHSDIPITYDWQPLGGSGVEARFRRFDWREGYTVSIIFRDQLETVIESADGKVLTLRDPASHATADAIVRHNDTDALQAAVDRAIRERKNLFLPAGRYRLSRPVVVQDAPAIAIQGQNAADTVLDISEGRGACLHVKGGKEVTLRDLGMLGGSGFAERDQAGWLDTRGSSYTWGFFLKSSAAMWMAGTERLLVENCHARRMTGECFYASPPRREPGQVPQNHACTKSVTYLRCSVEDCARNAFNNNFQGRDVAEDTNILYCRIQDMGGCAWEGASRFVRFIGNHVRNAGTVAMGNINSRDRFFEEEGRSAQHIIADNVFEKSCSYGGCAIRAASGASQVIIRNNLFVDFNASAVEISGDTGSRSLPSANALITGNIFDMTAAGEEPVKRAAVRVTASDVTVSDNQIYVRGPADALLTGVCVREDALNVNVHDNLVRHCGTGFAATRARGWVGEVVDAATFRRKDDTWGYGWPPLPARRSHGYKGWKLVWLKDGPDPAAIMGISNAMKLLELMEGGYAGVDGVSAVSHFDPETLRFTLSAPREMKPGEAFEMFPPEANWSIHGNTIADCLRPVALDAYGSETSVFRNNTIARGGAEGAEAAIFVGGLFMLLDNQLSGFEDVERAIVRSTGDPLGRAARAVIENNRCRPRAGEPPERRAGGR